MKFALKDYAVPRSRNYCIVDEVDSILIDEARTPLIISGPAEDNHPDLYVTANGIVPQAAQGRATTPSTRRRARRC